MWHWSPVPFHSQEWSTSNFPCSLTRNITSHSMGNLTSHSLLRWKIILLPILTTSLIHFSLKGWKNVFFDLGSEEINRLSTLKSSRSRILHDWSYLQLPAPTGNLDWDWVRVRRQVLASLLQGSRWRVEHTRILWEVFSERTLLDAHQEELVHLRRVHW